MGYFFYYFKVLSERLILQSEDGESAVSEMIVSPRGKKTIKRLESLARLQFDEHCQHDWDCCGNWYSHLSSVSRISGNKFRIVLSHNRNV